MEHFPYGRELPLPRGQLERVAREDMGLGVVYPETSSGAELIGGAEIIRALAGEVGGDGTSIADDISTMRNRAVVAHRTERDRTGRKFASPGKQRSIVKPYRHIGPSTE